MESPARGCSGSKCFYAPGFAVQGRCARAPSPASTSPFPFDIFYWLHTSFFLTSFSLYICYLASYQLSTIAPSTGSATLNCFFVFFNVVRTRADSPSHTNVYLQLDPMHAYAKGKKDTHESTRRHFNVSVCEWHLQFRVQGLGKQKQV